MSVTLDIPDQLADRLRTVAAQRGMSPGELGEQILAAGLATLAAEGQETVDLGSASLPAHPDRATVSVRSPIMIRGQIRPLRITLEPADEGAANAH